MSACRILAPGALTLCAAMLASCLAPLPVRAQTSPAAQCIASIHAALGATPALRFRCTNTHDCMYQAAAGNASALALLNGMADKLQDCWRKAGLAMSGEERAAQGIIRTYAKAGETCKLLLSISIGTTADGYRASCSTAAAR